MRRYLSLLFALAFALCLLLPAGGTWALGRDKIFDDGRYSYIVTSGQGDSPKVELIGYVGDKPAGHIVLPATATNAGMDYSVTSIAGYAFEGCPGLTGVFIPASVAYVGGSAFMGCASLAEIQVDPQNAAYEIVNGALYSKDGKTLAAYPAAKAIGHVTIPDTVTVIGSGALEGCAGLTGVTLPGGLETIGIGAFAETGLTGVTIPAGVKKIAARAFGNCGSLAAITVAQGNKTFEAVEGVLYSGNGATLHTYPAAKAIGHVTIPNAVITIGASAFYGCAGLTGITIPSSVTQIGSRAFYKCAGLTGITIPPSVVNMGWEAFAFCGSLAAFTVEPGNTYHQAKDGVLYTLDGKTLVCYPGGRQGAFAVPDDVETIQDYAFKGCGGLTSVEIPAGVKNIRLQAFASCGNLRSVTFRAATPPAMGDRAFMYNPAGMAVYVPAGSEAAYRRAMEGAWAKDFRINPPPAGGDYTVGRYAMLAGDGAAWLGTGGLSFTSEGPFAGYQWAQVDGARLPLDSSLVTEGSTVLTLKESYLATLAPGSHTLYMQFSGGYSEATFTTGGALAGPPKTGDSPALWACVATLAALAICLMALGHRIQKFAYPVDKRKNR